MPLFLGDLIMNVYATLHKAIKENLFDRKISVYIATKNLGNGHYDHKLLGNVNLKNKDSVLNFINQYGKHDVVGIRMIGITISEKPLAHVPDYDKDMLLRAL